MRMTTAEASALLKRLWSEIELLKQYDQDIEGESVLAWYYKQARDTLERLRERILQK